MKTFILITFFFTQFAFAQDGYHLEEKVICGKSESCLIDQKFEMVIKEIIWENDRGEFMGSSLTGGGFLGDVIYPKANYCYQGEPTQICNMLSMMANGHGGHAEITRFECLIDSGLVIVNFDIDYEGYGTERVDYMIKKCE